MPSRTGPSAAPWSASISAPRPSASRCPTPTAGWRPASKRSHRKAFTADAARLLALAGERNAVGFVLGLPINMDGSEGPRAQSTRAFARNFAKLTDLADRAVGRAAVDRRGRARADRHGRQPRPARRGDRRARRDLHPAGRARPAGERCAGTLRMAVVIAALLPVFPADRARLHPEADADTAGDAVAWAGAADLLRAVPGPADPDAGEGRPHQGAGGRCRRRADAVGAR